MGGPLFFVRLADFAFVSPRRENHSQVSFLSRITEHLEKDLAQPPERVVIRGPQREKSFSRRSPPARKQLTNVRIYARRSPCKIIFQDLRKTFDGTPRNLDGMSVAKHFTC